MKRVLCVLACLLLAACSDAKLTQIMVVVRSNIADLQRVEIRVEGLGDTKKADADVTKRKLPRTLAIVYRGGPLGPITIRARGFGDGDVLLVERSARVSFARDRNVTLVLDLVEACRDVSCTGAHETCIDGKCGSDAVDSKKLASWPGSVGKVDGGMIFESDDDAGAGGVDAGGDAGDAQVGDASHAAQDAMVDSGGEVITGCDDDHLDCKKHDGICETAIDTLENCGGCGDKCEFDENVSDPRGTLSCPERVCKVSCPSDRVDLDGKSTTGCEGVKFPIVVSHVDVDDATLHEKTVPPVVVDCDALLDFGSGALPATVGLCDAELHPLLVSQASGPDIVVVPVTSLTVQATRTLTLAGARPVAFVVFGDATIAGTISASAVGPSAGPGGNNSCLTTGTGMPGASGGGTARGGGGGGGGFGASGGAGGKSDNNQSGGAAGASNADATLSVLRGGCGGGAGGKGEGGASAGGLAGAGGGALQLSVAGTLTVSGTIAAAGGGGQTPTTENAAGGGGGGSGGALLLEAGMLSLQASGWLSANGGGGGEAESNSATGMAGTDGAAQSATPAPGGSAVDYGGDGGHGAAGGLAATAGKDGTNFGLAFLTAWGGGGGGGGGSGRIVLRGGSCVLDGATSPNASCM